MAKIELTYKELLELWEKAELEEFLDALGVEPKEEPKPDLPPLMPGIYLRAAGMDLIRLSEGKWNRVRYSRSNEDKITWVVNGWKDSDINTWVLVLDGANRPVVDGLRVSFDKDGNRVS